MKSLALSQLAPGPLAAQLAICLGYVHSRVRGATLVALAFILPSFLMTVAIGWLYVRFGGLAWMQAAFYGVGATVIGIITIAACKLAKLTMAKDRLQWVIFAVMAVVTAWTETEIVWLFLLCGRGGHGRRRRRRRWLRRPASRPWPGSWCTAPPRAPRSDPLVLRQGRRLRLRQRARHRAVPLRRRREGIRLADRQAVPRRGRGRHADPGAGRHHRGVHRLSRGGVRWAVAAAVGVFLPVYLFVVIPFPLFDRFSGNPQVKALRGRGYGGRVGHHCRRLLRFGPARDLRRPDPRDRATALAVAWRFKIPEPVLIAAGAIAGPDHLFTAIGERP